MTSSHVLLVPAQSSRITPSHLIDITPGPPDRLLTRLLDEWIVLPEEWEETPPEIRAELLTSAAPNPLLQRLLAAKLLTQFQVEAIRQGMENELIIGHYRLLEAIGRGGMGSVYRAEHLHLRRQVAVKVMSRSVETNQRLVHRFYSEARAVARLQHPNIVACLDAGLHKKPDRPVRDYYVMELIPGDDLHTTVRTHGPLSPKRVCELFRQIADALGEAHRLGLIHRDIKPSNIQITPDWQAKVLDFGLALQPHRRMTEPGTLLGTIGYMAPEQVHNPHLVDARADLFSLGATMYWALTGREPYPETGNVLQDLQKRLEAPPADVRHVRAEVPDELAELILRLTDFNPEQRFDSARAVAVTLSGFSHWMATTDSWAELPDLTDRTPRVLVVDDDDLIRQMVGDALNDCEVFEAADGITAWDMITQGKYDLLLLDINVPGMKGTEIIEKLQKSTPDGPLPRILVMSGRVPVETLGGLLVEGADDYLEKPFTFAGLRSRARGLLCRPNFPVAAASPQPVVRETVPMPMALLTRTPSPASALAPLELIKSHPAEPLAYGLCRLLEETGLVQRGYHERLGRYIRALVSNIHERGEYERLKDAAYLDRLIAVASVHDAAMLVVPTNILLKPARLDPEEISVVQTHTVLGSEVLMDIASRFPLNMPDMSIAGEVIRHHHERWNGTGYPDGLKGAAIPLSARVVAIVSVYEALRSRRPQRPPFSHARAVKFLTGECKGEFDPVVLEGFSVAAPWFETISQEGLR